MKNGYLKNLDAFHSKSIFLSSSEKVLYNKNYTQNLNFLFVFGHTA